MNEFLHAILQDPENDAPRLVYADHLTDQGHPRGELISLQIAVARGEAGPGAEMRIGELIDDCWDELAGVIKDAGVGRFCVRRGFVEAISVSAKQLAELPAIVARAPVFELTLTGPRDGALTLARMRELLNVRVLDLRGLGLGNRRCVELLRSPFLANVSTLILSGNGLGVAALAALVRSAPHMPCLEHLHLAGNRLSEEDAAEFAGSSLFDRLVTVDLDDSCDSPRRADGVWFPR